MKFDSIPFEEFPIEEIQRLRNTVFTDNAPIKKFVKGNANSGNFGHAGRPGEQGGSAHSASDIEGNAGYPQAHWEGGHFQPGALFHGTSSESLDAILKDGLVPHKGLGADEWAKSKGYNAYKYDLKGARRVSVYMTHDLRLAKTYANRASKVAGGQPIVLHIRIPKSQRNLLVEDERELNGWRFKGKIQSKWIDVLSKNEEDFIELVAVVFEYPFENSEKFIKGGSGSGNFNHEGRPGEQGGSSPVTGFSNDADQTVDSKYTYNSTNTRNYNGEEAMRFIATPDKIYWIPKRAYDHVHADIERYYNLGLHPSKYFHGFMISEKGLAEGDPDKWHMYTGATYISREVNLSKVESMARSEVSTWRSETMKNLRSTEKMVKAEDPVDEEEFDDEYSFDFDNKEELLDDVSDKLDTLKERIEKILLAMMLLGYSLGDKKVQVIVDQLSPEDAAALPTSTADLTDANKASIQRALEEQKKFLEGYMDDLHQEYKELIDSGIPSSGEDVETTYSSEKDAIAAVDDVSETSTHRLDMYAIAAIEGAMMLGTKEAAIEEDFDGGIWHTMHDGTVCDDCEELDGQWLSWDEFDATYQETQCNGNCRCGELFEPSDKNGQTDTWSDYFLESAEKFVKGGEGSGNFDHAGRPGEQGGSGPGDGAEGTSALSDSARILINTFEERVRTSAVEHIVVVAPDGTVLAKNTGNSTQVGFQLSKKAAVGATLTHNHPNSASFSHGDINVALKYRLSCIRASSEKYLYEITPKKGKEFNYPSGWDKDIVTKRWLMLGGSLDTSKLQGTSEEKLIEGTHIINAQLAEELGINYTRRRL